MGIENEVSIGRYLSGEMTVMEREGFEQRVLSNPAMQAELQAAERIWQHQPTMEVSGWDVEHAWGQFSEKIGQQDSGKRLKSRRLIYWAVAASALLLLTINIIFFSKGTPVTYSYQEGETTPIELKDGSKIYLNKASIITVYPFKGKKRHVELVGEAYFEVAEDQGKPFTISTEETLTEVVGTSFNIRETPGKTQIFVNSGKIIFSSQKDSQTAVALTEGESAICEANKMVMIPNPSPNVNAWRTQQLRFVKIPLSVVVDDISAYFDEHIIIENEATKNCRVNIPLTFKKPEISSVLRAVAASIDAKVVKEGDVYFIRGGMDCPQLPSK